jgi:cell division protein FtsB
MRLLVLTLAALLVLVNVELWFGKSGVRRVMHLQTQLETQRSANDEAKQRNQRLSAEVSDLREGLEMVEERARFELGMIRPDEQLVHYASDPEKIMPSPGATRSPRRPNTAPR